MIVYRSTEARKCVLHFRRANKRGTISHAGVDAHIPQERCARLAVSSQTAKVANGDYCSAEHSLNHRVGRKNVFGNNVCGNLLRRTRAHQEIKLCLLRRTIHKVLDNAGISHALACLKRMRDGLPRKLTNAGGLVDDRGRLPCRGRCFGSCACKARSASNSTTNSPAGL